MIERKSIHVRLSAPGAAALQEYALRRGLTRAAAASILVTEHLFGRDRAPQVSALPHKPDVDAGHVYIVRAGEFCKIGKSRDANKRLTRLRLPFEHELIARFDVANRHITERELHRRFADKRVNGEWFRLTDDDISGISRDLPGVKGK